jgi:hypothetical protein
MDTVPGVFYNYTWEMDITEYIFRAGRDLGLIFYGSDPEFTFMTKDPTAFTVNLGPNTFLQLPIVNYIKTVAPTCVEEGYELWTNASGGEVKKNIVPSLGGHIFGPPHKIEGNIYKGTIYCLREGCSHSEESDLPAITDIKIDSNVTMTVARGDVIKPDLILNAEAYDYHIVWTVSDPSFALIDDENNVYILNKTGTVRLIATDPVSGRFHSITLRIAS